MIEQYLQTYRSKGILVDTNLLLLLFIGGVSEKYIKEFKRTAMYTIEDYKGLLRLIDEFHKLVVTPNILTEVSNLSNGLSGERLKQFYEVFASSLSVMSEQYISSASTSDIPGFHAYGLADSGIIATAKEQYLVLTDDLRFASFARQNGVDVLNFNHIREAAWSVC